MKERSIDGQNVFSPLTKDDPRAIGEYTLTGRLGEGGMGTVYLGTSPTGRRVAVKVVKRQFTEDTGFAARFRSEVANARKVASFCTARVLDDGVAEDGRPYMVTDYISGTPLSTQIATYGPLEESPLVGMAFGVCAALAAIHAAGLVHRDLKPGNVILSMTGPRVIDFGIARALSGLTGPTLTGEVVGTPGWWAPEQIDGGPVTPAADVFAWGCLVAYAGTGRHPFGDGDPMTVAYRILHEEPRLAGLPEPLDRLVRRALHRDPALRPTARDLLLDLIGGEADGPSTHVLEALWEPPSNLRAPGGPSAGPDDDPGGPFGGHDGRDGTTRPDHRPGRPRHEPGGEPEPGPSPQQALPSGHEEATLRGHGPGAEPDPESPGRHDSGPAGYSRPADGRDHGPAAWRPGGRRRARTRAAAVVAAAALALIAGAALVVRWNGPGAGGGAGAPSRDTDLGRRVLVGERGLQFLVSAPPVCGGPPPAGGTGGPGGQTCRAYWFVLNMGGTPVTLTGAPELVDDAGGRHAMARAVGTGAPDGPGAVAPGPGERPVDIRPGQVLTFGAAYELPAGRTAVALTGRIAAGTAPIEVRL
ncbi:serine/threonine-protein kinase [Sphaerisporangium sp. NPDC004334]